MHFITFFFFFIEMLQEKTGKRLKQRVISL